MSAGARNTKIAALLRDYGRAVADTKKYRSELMRIAIEECGIDQAEAVKVDIVALLDGLLLGQGVRQAHRAAVELEGGTG